MTDPALKEWIRVVLIGAVLLGYLVVIVPEMVQCWRGRTPPASDVKTYLWSSIGALVGGVSAFYLGVDLPKNWMSHRPPSVDEMRGVYALVYVAVGFGAVMTWYARPAVASVLLKNAATTFVGLAVAVVSSILLPPA